MADDPAQAALADTFTRAARVLIGHDLVQLYPLPSGWRAYCECGEEFRGILEYVVTDAWHAHRDEAAENRGLT